MDVEVREARDAPQCSARVASVGPGGDRGVSGVQHV